MTSIKKLTQKSDLLILIFDVVNDGYVKSNVEGRINKILEIKENNGN
jgi:hypothetical protein